MRKIFLSLLVMTAAGTAQGADLDYDYLRGADYDPPPAVALVDWSGVYFGGHGGYTAGTFNRSSTTANFATSFPGATSYFNPIPSSISRAEGTSYGAFAGYNLQFDDVVVGLEGDYTHSGPRTFTTGILNGYGIYQTSPVIGTTRTAITDYGTIRMRAGYVMGQFMPYITAGGAIGQWNQTQTLYTGTGPFSATQQRSLTRTIGGFALGMGLEFAVTPNIILRGEYQYINFENNNARFTQLSTIRGGAAVKF